MHWKRITKAAWKSIKYTYVLQAELLQLSDISKLPKDLKRKTRNTVLKRIQDERQARVVKVQRTKEQRTADETFTWNPVRRR